MPVRVESNKARKQPCPKNHSPELDTYRLHMERASMEHLESIIRSKKAYGPVDENELMTFVLGKKTNLPKKLAATTVSKNRAIAIGLGLPTYAGTACNYCGGTERDIKTFECTYCQPEAVKARQEARRREKAHQIIDGTCKQYGVTREDVFGPSKTPEMVEIRKDIWVSMFGMGMSYSEIGRIFKRDHTTIRACIVKEMKKAALARFQRTHPVQPGELWG